jgi:hypothetical protein
MVRFSGLMTAAAALAAATAAVAAAPAGAPGKPPPAPRIFLSPSGEPFRQAPNVPDPMKAWFDEVDAAHKGYIDRADFRADAARFFKKLDENGDGIVDGFEVADYEAKIVPELAELAEGRFPGQFGQSGERSGGQGRGGQGGGGQGGGRHREHGGEGGQGQAQGGDGAQQAQGDQGRDGQGGRGRSGQRPIQQLIAEPEPVSGADFALDSHITLAEWMRATDQRFAILDANKDGRVTLDELRARFLPIKK